MCEYNYNNDPMMCGPVARSLPDCLAWQIADFGLGVNIFSRTTASQQPGPVPQFWSNSNKPQPYRLAKLKKYIFFGTMCTFLVN